MTSTTKHTSPSILLIKTWTRAMVSLLDQLWLAQCQHSRATGNTVTFRWWDPCRVVPIRDRCCFRRLWEVTCNFLKMSSPIITVDLKLRHILMTLKRWGTTIYRKNPWRCFRIRGLWAWWCQGNKVLQLKWWVKQWIKKLRLTKDLTFTRTKPQRAHLDNQGALWNQ